ncbi:hypothetical protein BU25DRAFT_411583 [Macroventuria anomochaeta]|uniref:Uncharacterized protein n=1 Tax=Macroventuria anomochaeta TaxID=301207 RepID=A0ACB6RY34_9PLEO|nr:uncharacterized protein BU25DRAFT_411583 [Macroventuria anomochaeta]KAF2626612.1 hypothetical protein BU25DRAFT_411583 [Macroventuria anomochaeta]
MFSNTAHEWVHFIRYCIRLHERRVGALAFDALPEKCIAGSKHTHLVCNICCQVHDPEQPASICS